VGCVTPTLTLPLKGGGDKATLTLRGDMGSGVAKGCEGAVLWPVVAGYAGTTGRTILDGFVASRYTVFSAFTVCV
jgi:hypothetical protein